MRRALGLILMGLLNAGAWAQGPRLLDSIPRSGDQQVDPGLSWIMLEFDRDMTAGASLCKDVANPSTYPRLTGAAGWPYPRVFAAQVQLEPGHDYEVILNCPASSRSFRDQRGGVLEPCPLVFRTSGAATVLTPEINARAVQELRRVIDEEYSYRDLRGIDWSGLFAQYGPVLVQARTAAQFADTAATLLCQAKDLHITVAGGGQTFATFIPQVNANINSALLPQLVPNFRQLTSAVSAGHFPDGIGYVRITDWMQDDIATMEAVCPTLWEAAGGLGLILDLRPNSGGKEALAQQVAGCFVDEPVVYAQAMDRSIKYASGFTPARDRILSPNKERPRYRGPVVVLMGRADYSSAEDFLLMMNQVPGCTLMGETTYGASGNPLPHDLGNGVTVSVPSWKGLRPDGTCFEAEGIAPDVEIHATQEQLAVGDPVLDAALARLRQGGK